MGRRRSAHLVSRSESSKKKSLVLSEGGDSGFLAGLMRFRPAPVAPLSPHPLPLAKQPCGPLRHEGAVDTAECGGEGVEEPKEAGGFRPPASLKTFSLPRLGFLTWRHTLAGGGPPLRYGLLREGEGWG